jgi:Na+-translocating ferredoxin:NAD+ oxidoreductase RnfG subunit
MFKIYFIFIFALAGRLSAVQVQALDQALKSAFPQATHFESQSVTLSAQERSELDAEAKGRSLDARAQRVAAFQDKAPIGSAWIDDEIGKHKPITYLVALDASQKIISVCMLSYREAYGIEARSPRFTRQFAGKGSEAALQVGQDLDAISGATLSCKTLAFGARKALRQEALFLKPKITRSKK